MRQFVRADEVKKRSSSKGFLHLATAHSRCCVQVAVIAQAPLIAPGWSLREQLTYPDTNADNVSSDRLAWLLSVTHLHHLLVRVSNDWDAAHDWPGMSIAGSTKHRRMSS